MNKKQFLSSYWMRLSLGLIFLSLLLHGLHLLLFRDAHHLAIYLLGDIAFVPFEVLLVSVILHRLLEHRAKREKGCIITFN